MRLRVMGIDRAHLEKVIFELKSEDVFIEKEVSMENRIFRKEEPEFTISIPRKDLAELLENSSMMTVRRCMGA